MKKYKAHIISHSHWDREWYLPYEKHHLRLIDLIDQILDEIDNNPKFSSFHLDGQTIIIEDYLQIKPQNKERLLNAIKAGKIKLGPWYVLQDAYLTSSEANIRNLQIGNMDCKNYGNKTNIGYFPDTFGIYSQAAQILKKSNIDNMFFGRGVTPTGFNNQVSSDFESKFSEMLIQSPNSDEVLGVLFANWYSNANEIPVSSKEAKSFWDQKLLDVKRFTTNKNLLFMNGCDHTPMQPDITQAIEVANTLYDDVEFIHSSLEDYLKEVKQEIKKEELTVINKELRSQDTEGYYTLVNTLSSRIYQKQENVKIQDMYEQVVEPMATMVMPKENYPLHKIVYGWKTLMQNHPHDSICGCSCDEVHDLMDTRFLRAKNIALGIVDEIIYYYKDNVQKEDDSKQFTLFNTTSTNKNEVVEIVIDYEKEYFGKNFNDNRKNLENKKVPNLIIKDEAGKEIQVIVEDLGVKFDYDLPKDKFRRSYYARKLKLKFKANINKFSWKTYTLEEATKSNYKNVINNTDVLENETIKVQICKDGKINLLNKNLNIEYKNIMEIVDEGDLGNEYMFGHVKNDEHIYLNEIDQIKGYDNALYSVREIYTSITIPISAEKSLEEEKRKLVEFYKRDSKREENTKTMPIKITLKLENDSNKLDVKVSFENTCKDHRMRFKFNLKNQPDEVHADGVFEVVKRKTKTSKSWKNPSNDQPMQKFVSILEGDHNLIVATQGLHEYEVVNEALYVTFLRSISEMGDWGDFPTPGAQCLKEVEVNISIVLDTLDKRFENYNKLRNNFIKLPYTMISKNEGYLSQNLTFTNFDIDNKAYISSLKRSEKLDACLRVYSNGPKAKLNLDDNMLVCNLLEEEIKDLKSELSENEILTFKLKDKK